jgi:integrase
VPNTGAGRDRGTIRQRGKSFQVAVYAGIDPITGRRLYLRETTASRREAQRALRRLASQVDEDRHAKTQATFRVAMESWLRTHEIGLFVIERGELTATRSSGWAW